MKRQEYYEENKEHMKEQKRRYNHNNKDKIKKRDRTYYEKNTEAIKERGRQYYQKNKRENEWKNEAIQRKQQGQTSREKATTTQWEETKSNWYWNSWLKRLCKVMRISWHFFQGNTKNHCALNTAPAILSNSSSQKSLLLFWDFDLTSVRFYLFGFWIYSENLVHLVDFFWKSAGISRFFGGWGISPNWWGHQSKLMRVLVRVNTLIQLFLLINVSMFFNCN